MPEPSAPSPLRILVVEDEVMIALELEALLLDLGHVTLGVAASSAEAVALGRADPPDVALVDVHLTDGPSGIDVARRLSENPRTIVLFTTANAKRLPPDFAGALGVIAKPYSERIITDALHYVAACRAGRQAQMRAPDGLDLAPGMAGSAQPPP